MSRGGAPGMDPDQVREVVTGTPTPTGPKPAPIEPSDRRLTAGELRRIVEGGR